MEPIIFWGMTEKELAETGEAEAHAENGAIRYYESLGFDPESLSLRQLRPRAGPLQRLSLSSGLGAATLRLAKIRRRD